jgi:soluble lytic murein transglycosylase-like protein
MVIGAAGSLGFPWGIEARQGIILGKSAAMDAGKSLRKPDFGHINARRLQQSRCLSFPPPYPRRPEAIFPMKRSLSLACLATMAALHFPEIALAQHAEYDALVATHARANAIPEVLVHRVIVRESRYRPALVGRGGTIGLMQIKLATARGLGYTGTAEGLRDPDTNLTYAVRYLAGAYRAANGDHKRAMHYYASGYYAAAKRQRLERIRHPEPVLASAPPQEVDKNPADANAQKVLKK